MESLPTKPKIQKNAAIFKNTGNENINEPTTTQEIFSHNNNSIINAKHKLDDECKNSEDITCMEANDNANINDHKRSDESKKSEDVPSQNSKISVDEKAFKDNSNDTDKENIKGIDSVSKKSNDKHNIDNQKALEVKDNDNKENEVMNCGHSNPDDKADKVESNRGNKITNIEVTDTGDQSDNYSNEKQLEASKYVTGDSSIQSNSADQSNNLNENESDVLAMAIKREPEEELSSILESMGENFTLIIENIDHSTVILEISDSSDDELEK